MHVYCALCMCTCLVIASFHYGSAGGRAALQRCNEINDPWFFRCDQQTKLSSSSKTKGLMGGKRKGKIRSQRTDAAKITSRMCRVSCQCSSQWGQQTNIKNSQIHPHCTSLSPSPHPIHPPLTFRLKPSAKCCQTLTSVPKMNCIPEPSESRIHL